MFFFVSPLPIRYLLQTLILIYINFIYIIRKEGVMVIFHFLLSFRNRRGDDE